jgi:hypothetical protein
LYQEPPDIVKDLSDRFLGIQGEYDHGALGPRGMQAPFSPCWIRCSTPHAEDDEELREYFQWALGHLE